MREESLGPPLKADQVVPEQGFRRGKDGQAGDDALHFAVEHELDAAGELQDAAERIALILLVVLIDDGSCEPDQRQQGARDEHA